MKAEDTRYEKTICTVLALVMLLTLAACGHKGVDYLVLVNKENKLPDDWEEKLETVTGYGYEPWHIRYVGSAEIAREITDKGVTLEEYLNVLPVGNVAPPEEE